MCRAPTSTEPAWNGGHPEVLECSQGGHRVWLTVLAGKLVRDITTMRGEVTLK